MGPTASGKTDVAVQLVQRFPFEIVSVDSVQIYKGMDIGTGKPDITTLKLAPHRLLDIRDPIEAYSVSDFRADAFNEISDIIDLGKMPLLVGGTMLYFKALKYGLADMPQADPEIRTEIEALAQEKGWEEIHKKLAKIDPDSAQRIHPNDPQRLQRALEIFLISGRTMSEFHADEKRKHVGCEIDLPFNLHFFAIKPIDRQLLHRKIEERFKQMVSKGLVDEVVGLYQRGDLHNMLPFYEIRGIQAGMAVSNWRIKL